VVRAVSDDEQLASEAIAKEESLGDGVIGETTDHKRLRRESNGLGHGRRYERRWQQSLRCCRRYGRSGHATRLAGIQRRAPEQRHAPERRNAPAQRHVRVR
jgi:hypothetical protein